MHQWLGLFLLVLATASHARSVDVSTLNYGMDFDRCNTHFPNQKPVLRKEVASEFELCNTGYAVLYEGKYKIPKVAFARITPEQLAQAKTLTRHDIEFVADPRLPPQYRSHPSDYTRSGYDRGHMLGNGFFGKDGQLGSFLMSNISPQLPHLNREIFSKIESDTRKYMRRVNYPVYIAVGQTHTVDRCQFEIGSEVCVIDQLFIAVYDPVTKRSWAHLLENAGGATLRPPIRLLELEERIGYRFWELTK